MTSPGVNFTNILRAAFKCKDPKSAKRQSHHQYLLALLGSTRVKASRKMLMKLIQGVLIAETFFFFLILF